MIAPPSRKMRFVALAGIATVAALVAPAFAHDPLEVSAVLVVLPDRMELRVSAGSDVARQFLQQSGFTPHQVAAMTRPDGAITELDATTPPGLSFFEIREGSTSLAPATWKVVSADTEIRFTAEYARPPAGTLDVRARYFVAEKDVLPGSFVAISTEKELATGQLSRDHDSLRVPLPDRSVAPVSTIIPHSREGQPKSGP